MLNTTGHDMVDTLRGVQLMVDRLDTFPDKVGYIRRILGYVSVREIFGSKLLVATSMAMAKGPDTPPDERILFGDGLLFTATADSVAYLYDPDIPIDALSLEFEDPEIMEAALLADPDEAAALTKLRLQVPVMAIDSVMELDAA